MTNLKWIKKNNNYYLKNNETTFVDLFVSVANGSSFIIGNKKYLVNRKRFWNSIYLVTSGDDKILTLSDSFWGNKAQILFTDGTKYSIHYSTRGGLKMRFMDGANEILSYALKVENGKNSISFSPGKLIIDTTQLLVLSALGMTIFTSYFGEDDAGGDVLIMATITAIT